MMLLSDIRKLLHAKPFVPFRLHLTDGTSVSVPHPDFAWAQPGWVMVVDETVPENSPPWVSATCNRVFLMHVARVEFERPAAALEEVGRPKE